MPTGYFHCVNRVCNILAIKRVTFKNPSEIHDNCKSVASLKVLAVRSTCHSALQPGQEGLVVVCLYILSGLPPYNEGTT